MTATIEAQADALLVAVVAREGGDIRAAFVALCARVTIEDVTGETFERALARAVVELGSRRRAALAVRAGEPDA